MSAVRANMMKSISQLLAISLFISFRCGWMKSIRRNKSSSSVEAVDDQDKLVLSQKKKGSNPIISPEGWMTSRRNFRRKSYMAKKRSFSDCSSIISLYIFMITLYTKDYCPYCVKAKNLLSSLGANYKEIDVTHDIDTLISIAKKSGMRTVPQIFVDDVCLGGFDNINALHQKGELVEKLGM